MSFNLFSPKIKKILLLDVGNGSVSAGVATYGLGQRPKLIDSISLPFTIGHKPSADELTEVMTKILSEAVNMITKRNKSEKNSESHISQCLVSLASPWFISEPRTISIKNEKEFIITTEFLEDVLDKEYKKFDQNKKNTDMDEGDIGKWQKLETVVTSVLLNGYNLKNSLGKKAKICDIHIYLSSAPTFITETIKKQLERHLHINNEAISFHSFPIVSISAIERIFPSDPDYIVVDITSETTDLMIVVNHIPSRILSVPAGKNTIIRLLAKYSNTLPDIALSTFHMYLKGELDDQTLLQMQIPMENIEKEWSVYLENIISELSPSATLPSRLYITSDWDSHKIYGNFLKTAKTDITSNFRNNANPIQLNDTLLKNFYDRDPRIIENDFLALLVMFIDR